MYVSIPRYLLQNKMQLFRSDFNFIRNKGSLWRQKGSANNIFSWCFINVRVYKLLSEVEMATLPLFLIVHKLSKNLQLPNGGFLLLLNRWVLTGSSKDKDSRSKLISASLTQVSANQQATSIKEAMSNSESILTHFKTQQRNWHALVFNGSTPNHFMFQNWNEVQVSVFNWKFYQLPTSLSLPQF